MTIPQRSAQPRQRGPIGRKMFAQTHGNAWTIHRLRSNFYSRSLAFPVLVIPLDHANVERIKSFIEQSVLTGSYNNTLCAEKICEFIGLTPAKRRKVK